MLNLEPTIRYLRAQAEGLDRAIESLEKLLADPSTAVGPATKRRGRKSMGLEERREVSARMKKYWASRRQTAR